jgi:hypothetical protein
MALEGGEYDAAFGRFVSVLDEKARHVHKRRAQPAAAHRDDSLIAHPDPETIAPRGAPPAPRARRAMLAADS